MKKVLAIALAVIMTLGMFSIAASAETLTFDQLPVFPEEFARVAHFALCHFLGRSGADDLAALVAALGTQVNDVVGVFRSRKHHL